MSIHTFVFTIALAPELLLGQLTSNTVTVTASQSASSQPDQAIFNVTVGSGTDKSLDDVAKSVASVGISAANLTGITFPPLQTNPPQLQWSFQLTAPVSTLKQTTASLAALQQSLAQAGGSLSFSLSGTQSSGSQAQSCDFAGLIANAQAQAQSSAAAAASAVGRIVGISGSTSQGSGNCSLTVTFGLGYTGNPGPHTISIMASRSASPVPDQVVFLIAVQSLVGAGLDDVTGVLTQVGVTGASLSGVSTETYTLNGKAQSVLLWSFTLTEPLANLKNTIAQLQAAQTAIANQNPSLTLSISVATPQTSQQAQPTCPQAALIADATAQAQALAVAAGVSAGQVTALSSVTLATLSLVANRVLATNGIFDPLGGSGGGYAGFLLPAVQYSAPPAATTCSLLAQFQLY
jgi:hypothetical protein